MKTEIVRKPSNDIIAGRQAMRHGEPWIVPESLQHLQRLIRPDFHVFEWGSGGSTIWFARVCAEMTAIEHIPRWYIWTRERLEREHLEAKVYFAPTESGLENYSGTVLAFEDESFDLISADGLRKARTRCIENALPKLKSGGLLLVDNSNWPEIPVLPDDWTEYRYQTEPFEWLGETIEWATSIFLKP